MATVHHVLYKADDFNKLDFKKYLEELITFQVRSVSNSNLQLNWSIKADNIHFNMDTSMPLGIMITEIITNAAKHAFEKIPEGEIYIEIEFINGKNYRMKIGDNGNGLPSGIDPGSYETMGFTLIYSLVDQINGQLNLDNSSKGTHYIIDFEEI